MGSGLGDFSDIAEKVKGVFDESPAPKFAKALSDAGGQLQDFASSAIDKGKKLFTPAAPPPKRGDINLPKDQKKRGGMKK